MMVKKIYLLNFTDHKFFILSNDFKILEESKYFTPMYWKNVVIHFNHISYRKELINNLKLDNFFFDIILQLYHLSI